MQYAIAVRIHCIQVEQSSFLHNSPEKILFLPLMKFHFNSLTMFVLDLLELATIQDHCLVPYPDIMIRGKGGMCLEQQSFFKTITGRTWRVVALVKVTPIFFLEVVTDPLI